MQMLDMRVYACACVAVSRLCDLTPLAHSDAVAKIAPGGALDVHRLCRSPSFSTGKRPRAVCAMILL